MGTYVKYRLADPSEAEAANDWVEEQPEYDTLADHQRAVHFWTEDDVAHVEEERGGGAAEAIVPGAGSIKLSGHLIDEAEVVKPAWADLFERMHEQFDIEIRHNYALEEESDYLTEEQRRKITDDGDALAEIDEFWA